MDHQETAARTSLMKEVTRMEMACEAARSKRCRMTSESVRIGSERM